MKRYIKPTSEFIEVKTSPILGGSNDGDLWIDGGGGEDYANPDGSDQVSGEHRGDWENIWGGM